MYREAFQADQDGPSTSGYGTVQAQKSEEDDKVEKDPKDEAFEDLVDKVSVAGWKEAFGERITWISHVFKVILLILSGFSFYYSYATFEEWVDSGYKDEISEISGLESLPMSNVTICVQVYLNQTYVRENVHIPPTIWHQYERNTGHTLEEFYRQLTLFLSMTTRPRNFTNNQQIYFYKIFRANPQMLYYGEFAEEAMLPCERMFRKCVFNGQEFDCCKFAVRSVDDDGICYLFTLNMDSDNAEPVSATFLQSEPGPKGGLTVELSVPLADFPWLEEDADNGFRVYVSPVPYSSRQSPLTAPHGAETFIKISTTKHKLAQKCSPYQRLNAVDSKRIWVYYDPEGFSCAFQDMVDSIWSFGQCEVPSYLRRPASNETCSPNFVYSMTRMVSMGDLGTSFGIENSKDFSANKATALIEDQMKAVLSQKAHCPRHCQYMAYDGSSSFYYLEPATETNAFEDKKRMRGLIHVYYSELEYRQYEETKRLTFYLMFCNLGNVWGLYWGMSIVSFFHVLFYLIRYMYYVCKDRKPLTPVSIAKFRNVRVKPMNVETTAL